MKTEVVNVRMETRIKRNIEKLAGEKGIPQSQIIRDLLEFAVGYEFEKGVETELVKKILNRIHIELEGWKKEILNLFTTRAVVGEIKRQADRTCALLAKNLRYSIADWEGTKYLIEEEVDKVSSEKKLSSDEEMKKVINRIETTVGEKMQRKTPVEEKEKS